MTRPRSSIGAELVPLVLILACLGGSLALIVSVHRRGSSRKVDAPVVALAPRPEPPTTEPARVTPIVPDEPEPPTPEDPTPKALAKLTSAEAEELLETSRADRKTVALEESRRLALQESERWRRRESLARLQLDSIDSKLRKMETQVDTLALERDALEKEVDARKALASQNRSRPAQAILPHRGQNGTWRRPIVVECSNGMATLRPQDISFGLLDLATGFGPGSNPFVATIAKEAVRIQGNSSPDGQEVVPYIFFLVRPDGIRAYYEARGRLEPLGITFGYELADQDWVVDFPDLDDTKTWDGSAPTRPDRLDSLAKSSNRPPGVSPAEDDEFPSWGSTRRGDSRPSANDPTGNEITWPARTRGLPSASGRPSLGQASRGPTGTRTRSGSGPDLSGRPAGTSNGPDPLGGFLGSIPDQPRGLGEGTGTGNRPGQPSGSGTPKAAEVAGPGPEAPRELALGDGPIQSMTPNLAEPSTDPGTGETGSKSSGDPDPANTFIFPSKPGQGSGGRPPTSPAGGSDAPDRPRRPVTRAPSPGPWRWGSSRRDRIRSPVHPLRPKATRASPTARAVLGPVGREALPGRRPTPDRAARADRRVRRRTRLRRVAGCPRREAPLLALRAALRSRT